MNYALAAIGSVTTAVRLKKTVSKISSAVPTVVHTPAEINKGGCSYSIRFNAEYINAVKKGAAKSGITIKGLYMEVQNGREREYHAIS